MYHSAIYLLAALYHESGRPSVAAGNTLAHTVGQARPFTEFADLDVEARMGRVLTARTMMERFSFESIDGPAAQSGDLSRQPGGGLIAASPAAVEAVAQAIHECERPAGGMKSLDGGGCTFHVVVLEVQPDVAQRLAAHLYGEVTLSIVAEPEVPRG